MLWFPVHVTYSLSGFCSFSHFLAFFISFNLFLSISSFDLSSCHCPILSLLFFIFSVSVSNVSDLHLLQLWPSITNSISLSIRLLMGLRFCCEMCGWGKKIFSVQKNDNLSFFSLGSQPVKMYLLLAMSLSVSRNVFFIVSRGLSGAMLRARPHGLSLSLSQSPLGFLLFFSSYLNFADTSHLVTYEQKVKKILCMVVVFFFSLPRSQNSPITKSN